MKTLDVAKLFEPLAKAFPGDRFALAELTGVDLDEKGRITVGVADASHVLTIVWHDGPPACEVRDVLKGLRDVRGHLLRVELTRHWTDEPELHYCLTNPSTALSVCWGKREPFEPMGIRAWFVNQDLSELKLTAEQERMAAVARGLNNGNESPLLTIKRIGYDALRFGAGLEPTGEEWAEVQEVELTLF